ncbi:MAG: glycoside hydrolase family 1 protein [Candidatus Omnitrophota bacterium]
MEQKILKFPKNFYWGASTSAHQVEGCNKNDWSLWEKTRASKLAQKAKNNYAYLSDIWPHIKDQAEKEQNYISGLAIDHYHKYCEDFELAKSLGLNAYRFSLEWSRIQPQPDYFDQAAITHYRQILIKLKQLGIEPFVCLWHWPLPVWISEKGGWQHPKTLEYFQKYVELISSEFKIEVRYWVTLNEPVIYSYESYFKGIWPPEKKGLLKFFRIVKKLIKAHKFSYAVIKKNIPEAKIGIAKNNIHFEAKHNFFINILIKKILDWGWNNYFLQKIKNHQDFIGLNHYFHNLIDWGLDKNENKIVSDLGWELYPESIFYVLSDLKKFKKPVYILENGLADLKDEKRKWFIKETLQSVYKAIDSGVDVQGYFHWSLLDNFEWDKGFWPRFGLIEVLYPSLERKIRQSAFYYAEIIKQNGLVVE